MKKNMMIEEELKKVLVRKIRLAKEIQLEFKKMRKHIAKLRKIKGYRHKQKIKEQAIRKIKKVKM